MPRKRKNKNKKKPQDLRIHAKKRFLERYGFEINSDKLNGWVKKIQEQDQDVVFIKKQSNSRTLYLIENQYYAVYNKNLHCICTFLTKEMVNSDYIYLGRGF